MDNNKIDEGLQGNEKIETAIAALQQEATADGWRSDADTGSADAGRQ